METFQKNPHYDDDGCLVSKQLYIIFYTFMVCSLKITLYNFSNKHALLMMASDFLADRSKPIIK